MQSVLTVVVTHDRLSLLLCCLEHLCAQSRDSDILVVDNASTDGTGPIMEQWAAEGKLLYLNTHANLGGAGGFSAGMRYAAERGYEFVWMMDDDCLPEPDALEKLLSAAQRLGGAEHFGFLSSRTLWTDGTVCVMNRQKRLSGKAEDPEPGLIRIRQATFVSFFIPVEKIFRCGLPLAPYFIWNDDIEYTRRLSLRYGEPCYLVNDSVVVHATANNYGNNVALDSAERLPRYTMAYRNECCTYRREGLRGVLFYIARCGRDVLRICFRAKDHKKERFRALIRGVRQGLRFSPAVEYPDRIGEQRERAENREN